MKKQQWSFWGLLFVVLLELAVVSWLVVRYEWLLYAGKTIVLQTIPVDPRDLFRGDYVILNYDVSLPEDAKNDVPQDCDDSRRDVWLVYGASEDEVSPLKAYHFTPPLDLPADEAMLKAELDCNQVVLPENINRYYVPEGTGYVLEGLVKDKALMVVLSTNSNGEATISGLRSDGKAIAKEGLF